MSNLRPCCGTLHHLPHKDGCMMNNELNGGDFKETLDETMDERGNRYGDFGEIARLSEKIQNLIFEQDERSFIESQMNPAQREAVRQISTKLARAACGDADYPDNWHDIQGYGRLAEEYCKKC